MEDIISRIFEIDRQAVELVDSAEKQKEAMGRSLEKEQEELVSKLAGKSREKLEHVNKTENEYADGKIKSIHEAKEKTLAAFNRKYEAEHTGWEEKIYKRVLEDV